MVGHSFGLTAAVYNYNRRSAIVNDILQNVFELIARNYYDDKYGFTTVGLVQQELLIVESVHKWAGISYSAAKLQAGEVVDASEFRPQGVKTC